MSILFHSIPAGGKLDSWLTSNWANLLAQAVQSWVPTAILFFYRGALVSVSGDDLIEYTFRVQFHSFEWSYEFCISMRSAYGSYFIIVLALAVLSLA